MQLLDFVAGRVVSLGDQDVIDLARVTDHQVCFSEVNLVYGFKVTGQEDGLVDRDGEAERSSDILHGFEANLTTKLLDDITRDFETKACFVAGNLIEIFIEE